MSLVLGGEFLGRTLILYFLCAPIFYLVIGFVTSLVMFWGYNLIARITGGIEFELKEVPQT
jgi:TM2 domain-containing membrane protein YozV